MKLFKNPTTNEIFAYELDGSQDHLIADGLVAISTQEAAQITQAKQNFNFENLGYVEKRQMAYPNFFDYLDGVVKNNQEQIQAYINACLEVKKRYPK